MINFYRQLVLTYKKKLRNLICSIIILQNIVVYKYYKFRRAIYELF
jgi:hypothetical protein